MQRTISTSTKSPEAIRLIEGLQRRFVKNLEEMARLQNEPCNFNEVEWLRNGGRHGGGTRFEAPVSKVFNTGSVNASHVHYEGDDARSLRSATALSTIIHPSNPFAPSVHIHLSFTELKDGQGFWRVMADLNPSILVDEYKKRFKDIITEYARPRVEEGLSDGEKYFFIPALQRHRGVLHFYLEEYSDESFVVELAYCERLITKIVDAYPEFIADAVMTHQSPSFTDQQQQLSYHTLYFLQVLTLDRGTTAGIMVHDQNDLGIMGSLPAAVDRSLLESWVSKHESPKTELLHELIGTLPRESTVVTIGPEQKRKLAACVRSFYSRYPEALKSQATGSKIPRTVANHKS